MVMFSDEAAVKSARAQGLSDGYHGYNSNPGDFTGYALEAYKAAFERGKIQSPFLRGGGVGARVTK